MSSANTPCAACKLQRRKCTQECVFAPYFPPDQPQKFAYVHKVFGASNVAKILNELNAAQREDAVNSLFYEAEARLRDPVYGCVGLISILQHRLKQVQSDLLNAKKELATYIGPQAMLPILQGPAFVAQQPLIMGNSPSSSMMQPHNMMSMMGIPTVPSHGGGQLVIRDPQHQHQHNSQQIFEAQPLGAVSAVREQHHQNIFRVYDQQHQPPQQPAELVRFNSGFETSAGSVTATGFSQMNSSGMSASLALGNFDSHYQMQAQQETHPNSHAHQMQAQLMLQPQQAQPQPHPQQQQRAGSEEGRRVGPSC